MSKSDRSSGSSASQTLLRDPRFLPFLPMIYVAWGDGALTAPEIEMTRREARRVFGDDRAAQSVLASWLDPERPPATTDLLRIPRAILAATGARSLEQRWSLIDLALVLAEASPDFWKRDETHRALREVYQSLGILEPGAGILFQPAQKPGLAHAAKPPSLSPTFDPAVMRKIVDGSKHALKDRVRALLEEPVFEYGYELSKEAYRQQVLAWLLILADRGFGRSGYPDLFSDFDDLADFVAIFESLAFFDLSLVIKFGVQFGLFGGSLYFLGTERHHTLLREVAKGRLIGCFAMTETDHGSNVRDLQTLATYLPDEEAWLINTPVEGAKKEWIGGAAAHARIAVVFAQLMTAGEHHGVHAFLTPLRDENGAVLPNITIEDCGHKMGLNGVDNGKITFDKVRIPRENLLDRYAKVSPDGQYSSSIASSGKRFFTMLGALVGGRVGITGAAISVAKSALTIAIRYGSRRRQFGPAGEAEIAILDYPSHQRRLMPRLATTYALCFAQQELARVFADQVVTGAESDLEGFAAAMKAYATRHTTETVQTCRECCGGQGYLSINRLAALKADSDVFTTFEGDNTVLLQLVAKSLLTGYRQQFEDLNFLGFVRIIANKSLESITELNPIRGRRVQQQYLRDFTTHQKALHFRETHLLESLARRLRKRISSGVDPFQAFRECQNHALSLANAHIERRIHELFASALDSIHDEPVGDALARLCQLFGLVCIERDIGWFQEQGYAEGAQARSIRKQVTKLCAEIRPLAELLTESFGISDKLLGDLVRPG